MLSRMDVICSLISVVIGKQDAKNGSASDGSSHGPHRGKLGHGKISMPNSDVEKPQNSIDKYHSEDRGRTTD